MNDVMLRDVAHARAGDKGDTSILSVFPLDDGDYAWLVRELTIERVRAHFGAQIDGQVLRYEVPSVCGLQFVCTHTLSGGVTTSLALDSHGKSMSSRLLGMRLPASTAGAPD